MFEPSAFAFPNTWFRSFINLDSPRACREKMPLAGRRKEGASSFLVESKLLLCTNTDEVNTGIRSPDILAENHNTQDESVLVCLSYDQLREKLAHTEAALAHAEAALLMDLREAAQVIYEAVHRLRNQVGRTRTPRKPCLTNCTTVPAWCGF